MSSQQFPRHGLPASTGGAPQISAAGNLVSVSQPSNAQGNFFLLLCTVCFIIYTKKDNLKRVSCLSEKVVAKETVVAMLNMGSRTTHQPEAGEPCHSEMTSRIPW